MLNAERIEHKLKRLSEELRQRGEIDLVEDVGEIIETLHDEADRPRSAPLMTTGEAARALGIRSINTIKRWASEGLLDGVRRGGRWLISSESVDRMLCSPLVSQLKEREAQTLADLDPFDVGEETPPPSNNWVGRKPWEQQRGTAS
ncbi:MAG: helix-turn-helix domain-containing protein [Chloroflexi bacterium]|nr:helix-turn-helix domain-containing protein [Chloroflexota bacterium]